MQIIYFTALVKYQLLYVPENYYSLIGTTILSRQHILDYSNLTSNDFAYELMLAVGGK